MHSSVNYTQTANGYAERWLPLYETEYRTMKEFIIQLANCVPFEDGKFQKAAS